MHTAPSPAAAQLPHRILGKIAGLQRDLSDLGVAVRNTDDIPAGYVGELDEEIGVLWVHADAPYAHRVWLMQRAWNFLVLGERAAPEAEIVPRMQLVLPLPLPRTPDEPAV